MKKLAIYCLSLAFASSCGSSASQKEKETSTEDTTAASEVVQEEVIQPNVSSDAETTAKIQNSMLLGEIEKKDFLSPPFDSWFNTNYDSYKPAPEDLEKIKKNIAKIDQVVIFMGTWCSDSKREIPHFFRILEESGFDLEKVKMIAVDRNKTAPDASQDEYQVSMVPTIIFYKGGEEVGRFVEYPRETLEKDVAKIVSGEPYKHSYEN